MIGAIKCVDNVEDFRDMWNVECTHTFRNAILNDNRLFARTIPNATKNVLPRGVHAMNKDLFGLKFDDCR